MRRRWWFGLALLLIAAIGCGIGFLTRPADDLARVWGFHPRAELRHGQTDYEFSADASQVLAAIPGRRGDTSSVIWDGMHGSGVVETTVISLPHGRVVSFARYSPAMGGATCILSCPEDIRPWYVKAWESWRKRFGA